MQAGIREIGDTDTRKLLVNKSSPLSISKQLECLSLSKNAYYYQRVPESEEEVAIMNAIDKLHTEDPTAGVIRMQAYLTNKGIQVGINRVRRLMRKMGIDAIYPKPQLSKLGKAEYIYPYLLRHLSIDRPNQVWSTDITYIKLAHGYMYLTAIIDVFSRKILAYRLSNSLNVVFCIEAIEEAIRIYGTPEIINTDQGSHYTSTAWINLLKKNNIQISMDGKGRCKDNIWIERFWRTIKYEHIFVNPADNVIELQIGIKNFIYHYNNDRPHQGIDNETPSKYYTEHLYLCKNHRSLGAALPAARQTQRSFS